MGNLTTAMSTTGLPSAGEDLMIALDIDGTILGHDGSLSKRVARSIHAHIAAGTHVMIATGRGIHGAQLALEQLGISSGVTVCSNGAITLGLGRTFLPSDMIGGRPIIESRSKCRRLDVGFPFRILNYHTFDPRREIELLHSAVPDAILAVEELDGPRRVSQHFPPGELSGQSVVFPVDQLGVPEATRLTVRALGMDSQELLEIVDSMGMKGVEYAVGWTAWLDVSPAGISKASALEALREAFGVAPSATVAVGDGGNDLEMIKWASCGVAMAEAPGYVLEAADAHTKSVHDDGLADVLEALL